MNERTVKLLEQMKEEYMTVAELHKSDGDTDLYNNTIGQAMGIQTTIWCLTDPEYLERMETIFFSDDLE